MLKRLLTLALFLTVTSVFATEPLNPQNDMFNKELLEKETLDQNEFELLMNKEFWSMMIKGWEFGKNAYFLYSSTSLLLYRNVEKALYDIVWYGPLIV